MAKKRHPAEEFADDEAPAEGEAPEQAADLPPQADAEEAATPAEAPRVERRSLSEIPFAPAPPECEYVPEHVELRLSPAQGRALRRLQLGLDRVHAEALGPVGNERIRVTSGAHALRWLLEQFGA